MCHPKRLPRTRPHPVPWLPYRIRPCSHLLFRDWKEQQRRLCKLSVLRVTDQALTFSPSGAIHYSLAILHRSSPYFLPPLHRHLNGRDIRYFLYFSLHVLLSNTSVSFTRYASSLVFITFRPRFECALLSALHVLQYCGVARSSCPLS
jgi:hypothetical protein